MCQYVDDLFEAASEGHLSATEEYWVNELYDHYTRNGHLSSRQLEVIRDIASRSVYEADEFDDYWY